MATFKGSSLNNTLKGGLASDRLYGYNGDDLLYGDGGNDLLDGGFGADTLIGGKGSDTYFVDNTGDFITEESFANIDLVNSSVSYVLNANVENLTLTGYGAIDGTGNDLANIVTGNSSKNALYGEAGNDTLNGGSGADTLIGANGDDQLDGGLGDDSLSGGEGTDSLTGGDGVDTLDGGNGDDIYFVSNNYLYIGEAYTVGSNDVINEAAGITAGIDTVNSSSSTYTLAANVENLFLTGKIAIQGIGNVLNNMILGNVSLNELCGGAGNDTLDGSFGIDTLWGGTGNDVLKLNDFSSDFVNGGKGIHDSLEISDPNQVVDILRKDSIKHIEAIKFTDNSHSTLIVTAKSILTISDSDTLKLDAIGENTLIMEEGWTHKSVEKGYEVFTKDGATLKVSAGINHIQILPEVTTYHISNVASAENVNTVFDSAIQEITIDFGGTPYRNWGLDSIDLTGFGLEDKLFIAQRDGALHKGTAKYEQLSGRYFFESTGYSLSGKQDTVFWQSNLNHTGFFSSTHHIVNLKYTTTNGDTYTAGSVKQSSASVALIGLPTGLSDAQFVFV